MHRGDWRRSSGGSISFRGVLTPCESETLDRWSARNSAKCRSARPRTSPRLFARLFPSLRCPPDARQMLARCSPDAVNGPFVQSILPHVTVRTDVEMVKTRMNSGLSKNRCFVTTTRAQHKISCPTHREVLVENSPVPLFPDSPATAAAAASFCRNVNLNLGR